jgi:hypothetical protein
MSLVAYLPVVEVVDKTPNADGIVNALGIEINAEAREAVKLLLQSDAFPPHCSPLHDTHAFFKAFEELLKAKQNSELSTTTGGAALDAFAEFFGEPDAIRRRIMTWLKDRHQQPAGKGGDPSLEPAWLDFLVVDLTCRRELATVRVPPWMQKV